MGVTGGSGQHGTGFSMAAFAPLMRLVYSSEAGWRPLGLVCTVAEHHSRAWENQLLSAPWTSALKVSCDLKLVNCLEQFELDISIKLNSGFHQPCILLSPASAPEGFCT